MCKKVKENHAHRSERWIERERERLGNVAFVVGFFGYENRTNRPTSSCMRMCVCMCERENVACVCVRERERGGGLKYTSKMRSRDQEKKA